jgi:hypothetical protein
LENHSSPWGLDGLITPVHLLELILPICNLTNEWIQALDVAIQGSLDRKSEGVKKELLDVRKVK